MEFQLTIRMGNEAMEDNEDLTTALLQVVRKLDEGRNEGPIKDSNGNTVGAFLIAQEG